MAAANWYPDPTDPSRVRWWDGTSWTEHTSAAPQPQPAVAAPTSSAPSYATPTAGGSAYDAASFSAAPSVGTTAPPSRGQTQGSPFQTVPMAPAYTQHEHLGQRIDELVVRRLDGQAYLPATAIAAGAVPSRCSRHGSPAVEGRKTTHQSRLPVWVYLTILFSIVIFVIAAHLVRKSVVSRSWPFCAECIATRRRNLTLMWVSLALFVLVLWLMMGTSITESGNAGVVLLVALFLLPVAALAFGGSASTARLAGCEVTEDGLLVGVPVAAFGNDFSRVGAVRPARTPR